MAAFVLVGFLSVLQQTPSGEAAASRPIPATRPARFEPVAGLAVPVPVLRTLGEANGVSIVNGGFGSSLARDPNDPNAIYLLTDRGPNVDGHVKGSKVFSTPGFSPQIGRFVFDGKRLTLDRVLELATADGVKLVGTPPQSGAHGGTVEAAFDASGDALETKGPSIDPEGLAAMPDGTFWIAEEYGPSLVHVDGRGRVLEWLRPGTGRGDLPQVLRKRRLNNGFEGVALLSGGKKLAAIVQGALQNAGSEPHAPASFVRILTLDLETRETKQVLYPLEAPTLLCSDLVAFGENRVLVLERDGALPSDSSRPSQFKRVFEVDLGNATDVSCPENGEEGRLVGGKPLEAHSLAELGKAGIVPARKRQVLDLLAHGYPHDKPEGLAVFGDELIAIVNDDDFGVVSDRHGKFVRKGLPASGGATDTCTIRFYAIE